MSARTDQVLLHHRASCFDCEAGCEAANALAWAHNHARSHGHHVALELAYSVRPREPSPSPARREPKRT